jgi:hypothetical protein
LFEGVGCQCFQGCFVILVHGDAIGQFDAARQAAPEFAM